MYEVLQYTDPNHFSVGNGSVNSKRVHTPQGICRAFRTVSVPAVGNLLILREAVNIVRFPIFHLKSCLIGWL